MDLHELHHPYKTDSQNQINPREWPILSIQKNNSLLYANGGALLFSRAIKPPNDRATLLELFEYDLSKGRKRNSNSLQWTPQNHNSRNFLHHCYSCAMEHGGIQIHTGSQEDIPLEAMNYSHDPQNTAASFLRLSSNKYIPLIPGEENPIETASPPAVFIYFNPTLSPRLPIARQESEDAYDIFQTSKNIRYIARELHPDELEEHCNWADIVIYFGHGTCIQNIPNIPSHEEWIPFSKEATFYDWQQKVIIFAACMEDIRTQPEFPFGTSLYPVCRIMDRKSNFLHDFFYSWKSGMNVYEAYLNAAILDASCGDIRRYVFQLRGQNKLSHKTDLFTDTP